MAGKCADCLERLHLLLRLGTFRQKTKNTSLSAGWDVPSMSVQQAVCLEQKRVLREVNRRHSQITAKFSWLRTSPEETNWLVRAWNCSCSWSFWLAFWNFGASVFIFNYYLLGFITCLFLLLCSNTNFFTAFFQKIRIYSDSCKTG